MSSKSFQNASSLNTQRPSTNGYGLKVGDSTYWLETWRPQVETSSSLDVLSATGLIGINGASRTSTNPNTAETKYTSIGGNFYGVNDRPAVDPAISGVEPRTAYAAYLEGIRVSGAAATYGAEIDVANLGTVVDVTPQSPLGDFWPNSNYTGCLILNSGAGRVGANSASFGLLFGYNAAAFRRGIVFNSGSIDPAVLEAIAFPLGYKTVWYEGNSVISTIDHREHSRAITSASVAASDANIRRRSGGETQSLDTIYSNVSLGQVASSDYPATTIRTLQRTSFSGGSARFSLDFISKNTNGSNSELSFNGLGDRSFGPSPDDSVSLGLSSFRWSVVYAATGTINTSDEREKQNIESVNDAEKRVAFKLKTLVKKFKFKSAVLEKKDKARIHFGIIAQEVKKAFEDEGLVAEDYGVLCYDEWDSLEEVKDEKGNVVQAARTAGSRYGVRYEELFALIISAL
jgi:hypothetical protein